MNSIDRYRTLLDSLVSSWNGLPDKPDETPEFTLQAIWQHVSQADTYNIHSLPHLDDEQYELVLDMVHRRTQGTPLAYLLGHQDFLGIRFLCTPQAMIPRKETELLAQVCVETVRELVNETQQIKVIDLCTGCGNIALSMAYYEPACRVIGSDISPDAISLAQRNANHLHLADRVEFLVGDLFSPFSRQKDPLTVDLVTCNPPYVSTANLEKMAAEIQHHEPRHAFDGGHFGIQIMIRLLHETPSYLKHQGWLCFEVGLGQGQGMVNMLKRSRQYDDIQTFTDINGEIRVIKARLDGKSS